MESMLLPHVILELVLARKPSRSFARASFDRAVELGRVVPTLHMTIKVVPATKRSGVVTAREKTHKPTGIIPRGGAIMTAHTKRTDRQWLVAEPDLRRCKALAVTCRVEPGGVGFRVETAVDSNAIIIDHRKRIDHQWLVTLAVTWMFEPGGIGFSVEMAVERDAVMMDQRKRIDHRRVLEKGSIASDVFRRREPS